MSRLPSLAVSLAHRAARLPGAALFWRERWWLVAFAAVLTLCRLPTVGGWDEAFYVGQLTSAIGDRDLRLQDDVVLVPKPFSEKCRILTTVLPSGALVNTFSIGPAIVLSLAVLPLVSASSPPPWLPFRAAAAFAAMALLVLTALVTTRAARRFGVSPDTARLGTAIVLFSSPLALYATRSYLNAHAWGALLVALALHQSLLWVESRKTLNAIALGLAAGLACVNRWQDAVVVLPIALFAIGRAVRDGRPWRSGAAAVALAAALAGGCQLLAWRIQFGTAFLVPQGSGYMRWSTPALVPLLVSTYHGLVPWTPGLALGLVALALAWRDPSHRWLFGAMALGAGLSLYVSACPEDWWGRDAFGPRRLTSLAPLAAVGMSLGLARLKARSRVLLTVLLGLWATVAISAHLSSHDDLLLLFTGRGDPLRPAEAVAPGGPTWINSWGALHALKPGFSLSDAPRLKDRLVGIACVALVIAVMRLSWPLLARRRTAQRLAVGFAAVHVAGWLLLLATLPANRGWDEQWRDFLQSPLDPVRQAALPPGMSAARDVVVAMRASRASDAAVLQQALARLRQQGIIGSAADARSCRSPR